ncbi:MAG: DUF3277 family protein [Clostridia bacterium]|nr:DUF3277 family protein [Clostridia bacterium]
MPTETASSTRVSTYNSRLVTVVIGTHHITGMADDSFVQISPLTDGISSVRGCDGEVARALDPNTGYAIKIVLLQTSTSNDTLNNYYIRDRLEGEGMFPIEIKDAKGGLLFHADTAWVVKPVDITYGKGVNNREWNIETGPVDEWQFSGT